MWVGNRQGYDVFLSIFNANLDVSSPGEEPQDALIMSCCSPAGSYLGLDDALYGVHIFGLGRRFLGGVLEHVVFR